MVVPDRIITERLVLRKPQTEDADVMFQSYTSDSQVTKYLTWQPHRSVEDTRSFVNMCIAKWDAHEEYNFIIQVKESDRIIGMIKMTPKNDIASIGYVIAKNAWNNGYTTEATKKIINFLFKETSIEKVTSFCDSENKASAKVMEKSGMHFKCLVKEYVVHPNISPDPRDAVFYEVTKKE